MKKKLISYLITIAAGLVILAFAVNAKLSNPDFVLSDTAQYMALLTDAFFVPGILLLCVWCLVFIASTGLFDSVSYAISYAARALLPFAKPGDKSFYDYKMGKEERRAESKTPLFILVVGIAYSVLSVIFLALYYIYK